MRDANMTAGAGNLDVEMLDLQWSTGLKSRPPNSRLQARRGESYMNESRKGGRGMGMAYAVIPPMKTETPGVKFILFCLT